MSELEHPERWSNSELRDGIDERVRELWRLFEELGGGRRLGAKELLTHEELVLWRAITNNPAVQDRLNAANLKRDEREAGFLCIGGHHHDWRMRDPDRDICSRCRGIRLKPWR